MNNLELKDWLAWFKKEIVNEIKMMSLTNLSLKINLNIVKKLLNIQDYQNLR